MADIYMDSNSSAFTILEQARQEFWNSNTHLTEEQRHEAMHAQPSMAHQIPRTMPSSISNLTQLPVWTQSLVVSLSPFF